MATEALGGGSLGGKSGDIRYVAGAGTLLGAGDRWLLLGGVPDEAVLDRLWSALTAAPAPASAVRAVLAPSGVGSWALVDGVGDPVTSGQGSVTRDGDLVRMGVGLEATGPEWLLTGGMVRAAAARLRVPEPPSGIIDGIPADILASQPAAPPKPSEPPAPEPSAPEPRGDTVVRPPRHAATDPDHDGHTAPRSVDHLRQPTHETVLAVRCPDGHLTPAHAPVCRACRAPVPPQTPQRVPRPRLGGLRMPNGEVVPLDRGVVLGRKPSPVPGGEDWPHLVPLPPDETFLSRVHLQIELDGWLVVARDLGSRGGTTLKVPGRPPERIRANEAYVLEPGHALDLADVYEVVYEVGS